MAKVNTNFESVGRYVHMLKVRHGRVTSAPTIGFEYEIPLNPEGIFCGEDMEFYREDPYDFRDEMYDLYSQRGTRMYDFNRAPASQFGNRML